MAADEEATVSDATDSSYAADSGPKDSVSTTQVSKANSTAAVWATAPNATAEVGVEYLKCSSERNPVFALLLAARTTAFISLDFTLVPGFY